MLETGPIRQKALLAVLALRANRVCSPEELLDTVWEDRLPSSGVKIIPPYIYRIRKLLPLEDLLERTRDGYVLRLPAESVDVEQFESAVRTATDPADYSRALELFRGEPLAGLPGHWLASQRTRLQERRYKVLGDKIALDLDRGRHVEAVAELATAAEERPMDERIARDLAESYPDGRLFLDLHGHTPGREPLDVGAAVDHLLATIGVQAGRIPTTTDERLALWRSEVADRRVLVVLDNAPNSQVVRALLPGSLSCGVLVTSLRQLVGLDAGIRISLDVLTAQQAGELLARVVGATRTAGQERASLELAEHCGHLPLAIRIAGSRLRHRPSWTVEYLNSKLAAEDHRLDELSVDGRGVATAFAISYEHLPPEEQLMFRRLSLMPGRDADQYAAAALTGLPDDRAEQLLEDLVDANLLLQLSPGRFQFHDLVRQYAAELCAATDDAEERAAATNRVIDYYLQTTRRASAVRQIGYFEERDRGPVTDGRAFSSLEAAVKWAGSEGTNFLAVLQLAKDLGRDETVWQLAAGAAAFLHHHGRVEAHEAALAEGLSATRRLGDSEAEGRLELIYGRLIGLHPQLGLPHLEKAAKLVAASIDGDLRANVLASLALAKGRADRSTDWEAITDEAITLARAGGHKSAEIRALRAKGLLHSDRTQWSKALDCFQAALVKAEQIDDEVAAFVARNSMAECYLGLDRPEDALAAAQAAKADGTRLQMIHSLATPMAFIGSAYVALGELDLAVQAHREAVEVALRSGVARSLAVTRLRLGGSLLAAGRRDDSRSEFLAALQLSKADDSKLRIARCYAGLADCAEADDNPEHAVELLDHAVEAIRDELPDYADELRERQRALRLSSASPQT